MATKAIICSDDRGQVWWVYDGDPAHHLVRKLYMRGVHEIVLPRRTIITGQLVALSVPTNLASFNVSNEALAALLRRFVRLRDCLAFLVEAQHGSHQLHTAGQDLAEVAV